MEKHNLELNSACSSNYLEPHTNNSNKRAFDYEHANSAMNYKVAEEELVVSIKVFFISKISWILLQVILLILLLALYNYLLKLFKQFIF